MKRNDEETESREVEKPTGARPGKNGGWLQTGNPGRRARKPLTEALRAALDDPQTREQFVRECIFSAKGGNASMAKLIWDRLEGLLTLSTDEEGQQVLRLKIE